MSERAHRSNTSTDHPREQNEVLQSGDPAGPLDDRIKHVRRGREEASAQIARTLRVWRKAGESNHSQKPDAKEKDQGEAKEAGAQEHDDEQAGAEEAADKQK